MTSLPLADFKKRMKSASLPYRHKKIHASRTCPKCGGNHIKLMPTDFETAKCETCNHTFSAASEQVTKQFSITTTPEVLQRFEAFLAHLQHCSAIGHSCTVAMDIDGDGADRFTVSPKVKPRRGRDVVESKLRVERV